MKLKTEQKRDGNETVTERKRNAVCQSTIQLSNNRSTKTERKLFIDAYCRLPRRKHNSVIAGIAGVNVTCTRDTISFMVSYVR